MKIAAQLAFLVLFAAFAAGCRQEPAQAAQPVEIQTIETTPVRPAPVEPPPVIEEQTLPQRPLIGEQRERGENEQPSEDEQLRAKMNLPFAPPIALDPVDGSKVSITKETPIYSYENKWYYFSSEANKREFTANPEQYTTGSLARY